MEQTVLKTDLLLGKEFSPQLLQLANETDQILHHSIGDMSLEEILSL